MYFKGCVLEKRKQQLNSKCSMQEIRSTARSSFS